MIAAESFSEFVPLLWPALVPVFVLGALVGGFVVDSWHVASSRIRSRKAVRR